MALIKRLKVVILCMTDLAVYLQKLDLSFCFLLILNFMDLKESSWQIFHQSWSMFYQTFCSWKAVSSVEIAKSKMLKIKVVKLQRITICQGLGGSSSPISLQSRNKSNGLLQYREFNEKISGRRTEKGWVRFRLILYNYIQWKFLNFTRKKSGGSFRPIKLPN